MKVKLLKKIRKRYSITFYPDGGYVFGDWESKPFILLKDNYTSYRSIRFSIYEHFDKNHQYNKAWNKMRNWIREDYKTERKRRNYKIEKLWFQI